MRIAACGLNPKAALLPETQTVLFHQSAHSRFAATEPPLSQPFNQTRAAIAIAAGFKDLLHHGNDVFILLAAHALSFVPVSVKATDGDLHHGADLAHRERDSC